MEPIGAPNNSTSPGMISSPAATGGAGTLFEQNVSAFWLALLLVRAIPPILRNCVVTEVHFQTEHLGRNTDDFLVVGETGSGTQRKLLGQVKRSFTVRAGNEDFKKTIGDAWKDFQNTQLFAADSDAIAIVTLRGTNTLLEHFVGLLDCARAASDVADFEHRLGTPGLLHSKVSKYCNVIRQILDELDGHAVSMAEVWPFLKALHLISLDLATSTAQAAALVKTLLAHTAHEQGDLGGADSTWNTLLQEVAHGMTQARSYTRAELPEDVLERHAALGQQDHRCIIALENHSSPILRGLKSTLGSDLHLPRIRLVQDVLSGLELGQVVILTGQAGSGKSIVAKDALAVLEDNHFVFCLRAEEFACAHLDETLLNAQVSCNAVTLASMLAGQNRKVLLVESVERLLEKSTRDAFSDLLHFVHQDPSWRLLLTCRDYSADLVRDALLNPIGVNCSLIPVSPLDDEEMDAVGARYPEIIRPLSSVGLRSLLRIPYFLDMALRMPWPNEEPLPSNEREFRSHFWQLVVRADHRSAAGMPQRREHAFLQIALGRARALFPYVPSTGLDTEAVQALKSDSLVNHSQESRTMIAPAHDVLEDWAILHWINDQFVLHQSSIAAFVEALGDHPALRRTYRKWVSELVERDPGASDELFVFSMSPECPSAHFRDDSLIAMLQSPGAAEFIKVHQDALFRDEKTLLRRIIHLLRVGCMKSPEWLTNIEPTTFLWAVPDGPAWSSLLHLVRDSLQTFAPHEQMLLLGLIEDWSKGVSVWSPYPQGAEAAAEIAYWLVEQFDDYQSDEQQRKALQVIAKVPKAKSDTFSALLRGSSDRAHRDSASEALQKMIFAGSDGMPAARDFPELVVEVGKEYILCNEQEFADRDGHYYRSRGIEAPLGIKEARQYDFFPPSGIHGLFHHLLRHKPLHGLRFIVEISNCSAEWYAQRKNGSENIEPPFEITLTFSDGSTNTQWCNGRLWNLYRATSVGPNVLQSALMALESWLLELAEERPDLVDTFLLKILRDSKSVALTAVAASIATAHPDAAGEALLVLLSSSDCILLDRQRMVLETQTPTAVYDMFPTGGVVRKVHAEERRRSDARPHRRHDLEVAILGLQFGPLAARVQEVLDKHRSKFRPVKEQDDYDHIWRIALHRMDLRLYTATEMEAPSDVQGAAEAVSNSRQMRLDLQIPDTDIQEMSAKTTEQYTATASILALLMWGVKVFWREKGADEVSAEWQRRLCDAMAAAASLADLDERDISIAAPVFVAAICVRDHWDEMSNVEQTWCVDVICTELEHESDNWTQMARAQRNIMAGNRPAAYVLPVLFSKALGDPLMEQAHKLLVLGLTHPVDEVRTYTAMGVGQYLWKGQGEMALRCINVLALQATLVEDNKTQERTLPYSERRSLDMIEEEVAAIMRGRFFEDEGVSQDEYLRFNPNSWEGMEANYRILLIMRYAPAEPATIAAFERLAHDLVACWDEDEARKRGKPSRKNEINHEAESGLTDLLENYLFQISTDDAIRIIIPIADAVDRHPDKTQWFLQGLIQQEDGLNKGAHFWSLWSVFAERVQEAKWLRHIDDEHSLGSGMMSSIFLGSFWKEEVCHWRSLEGHAHHVHSLFEGLPPSALALEDFVRFLYQIGEQSLPEAFIRIAKSLRNGDPQRMLRRSNTVFCLEVLLQRYVYGRPMELKQRQILKEAVLGLLDMLVERGSSAAFRMRDDFVTPLPT